MIELGPRISNFKPIKGKIKELPEDFIVSEMIDEKTVLSPFQENYLLPGKAPGLFLHFVLIKKNLDTERALDWLSKLWNVNRDNFNIAGTKDKKAITAQRVSVWGLNKVFEKGLIGEIDYPTLKAKALTLKLRDIKLGDLWGNMFNILIRNISISKSEIKQKIEEFLGAVKNFGGLINSFGPQRFGDIRPITHLVGKLIIEGNYKEAIRLYIGKVFPDESDETKKARKLFWEGEKVNEVLKFFPSYLNTERKLLFLLRNSENNYEHAFQSFSYHLKKLFVHAYQSHLFNKYLKMRFEKYSKNFKEPISGEKLKDGIVYAPIVGAKTELNGETRDIYVTIFEEEGLKEDFFASSAFKRFGGKGAFRKILFVPYDFSYEIGDDDIYNNSTIKLNFKLKKGSYATNVIREFII
ncbi:MAG: tRNA pseudouridine(13) synthase TruD [Candidatus Heimdallarchaeum endolithica]|uniref:Probable tRNA pseudouridine synthase D n=1 Tax=Candidatus Heimdallarchaeum endolithica TaxID=2876572 RepID=A0A9Y1BPP4_9ARCH|nr:MAG: tRNA pseudouridine(13) synthase TruD [Candidatus Heimdallarchaeum endolithica]